MKSFTLILFFFLSATLLFGQNHSLVGSQEKIESIESFFYQQVDSLERIYKNKLVFLDSARQSLNLKFRSATTSEGPVKKSGPSSIHQHFKSKTDSIQVTGKLVSSLDSIIQKRDTILLQPNQKIQILKDKTVGKLKELDPLKFSENVSRLTSEINGFQIPGTELSVPSINSEGIGDVAKTNNLQMSTPIQQLNPAGVDELKNVDGQIGGITDTTGKLGEYGKEVRQLSKGNLSKFQELPNAAEGKVQELSGLNEIKDQTKVFDEYKDLPRKLKNPDSLKAFAIEEAKQAAIDHFAGQDQQLKEAMQLMSKYKKKYPSINSLEDIKRRQPNEMKGKPRIERIVPGIGIQIQKKGEDLLVDFNPYAAYRFTGRISAGLGWNQRVSYNLDINEFNPAAKIYGPRVFGEYKLWRGFSPRAEVEVMNTNVPPLTPMGAVDPVHREWVWGAFVGLKKEYRFFKKINGTAMIMTRLFNPDHKSPYADVLNVRFGFEFPMKKKIKTGQ